MMEYFSTLNGFEDTCPLIYEEYYLSPTPQNEENIYGFVVFLRKSSFRLPQFLSSRQLDMFAEIW